MSLHEKLEQTSQELFNVNEAADMLTRVSDCEDVVDILRDRALVLAFKEEEIRKQIEERDRRDEYLLVQEYWRSVI